MRLLRALMIVTLLAVIGSAQSPGYLTNSNLTGTPDYGSFLSSKLDSVNLANGGLQISVPLVSRSVRGTTFSLAEGFGSKYWVVSSYSVPCDYPDGGETCTYYNWHISGDNSAQWRTVQQPDQGMLNFTEQGYTCMIGGIDDEGGEETVVVTVDSNFVYTTPSGTKYQFPNKVTLTNGHWSHFSPHCDAGEEFTSDAALALTYPDTLVGESDTAHAQLTLSISTNPVTWEQTFNASIVSKSGAAVYSDTSGTSEDTNGNVCCGTAGGWTTDAAGRPVARWGGSGGVTTLDYYDANGAVQTMEITGTSMPISTTFPTTSCGSTCYMFEASGFSLQEIASITLANGLQYTFSYGGPDVGGAANGFGEPTGMTLPNGGSIKYVWQTIARFDYGPIDPVWGEIGLDARVLAERDVNDGAGHVAVWKYNYGTSAASGTTVTNPDGNDEVHTFAYCTGGDDDSLSAMPLDASVESFTGTGVGRTALRKSGNTWTCDNGPIYTAQPGQNLPMTAPLGDTASPTTNGPRNSRIAEVTTTLEDVTPNQVRATTRGYDDAGNVAAVTDTDWGAGAPGATLRVETMEYAPGAAYAAAHIWDRMTQKKVVDGAGTQVALENYSYDGTTLGSTSGTAVGHDYTNYSASNTVRGNVTGTSSWVSGASYVATTTVYNDLGEKTEVRDGNSNPTDYGYADSWANATCAPGSGAMLGYVTSISNALGQTTTRTVNSCDGSLATETDPNIQTWSWNWDGMGRLSAAIFPDTLAGGSIHGETDYSYTDSAGAYAVETQRRIDASRWTDAHVYFDGLGRATSQAAANDETVPWDQVVTQYDLLGRKAFQSYPCQASTPGTAVCTAGDSFGYDALSRPTLTTHSPDGSTVMASYAGRATETQDEGNGSGRVASILQSDGLGAVASVCEVSGAADGAGTAPVGCGQDLAGTGFVTSYTHDALGNLVQVMQDGLQNRNFQYDGVSRLRCAANPETGATAAACTGSATLGATTYSYDADSNVLTRTRPAPNQGLASSTLTTSYSYDALDRLLTTSYSDGSDAISRSYDQTYYSNAVGRLTQIASTHSFDGLYYDAVGRVVQEGGCTPNLCGWTGYNQQYGFDLLGDETSSQLGNDFWGTPFDTLTTTFNRAGRATGVASANYGTLASEASYNGFGEGVGLNLGGLAETRAYDGRGRATAISAGGAYSYSVTSYAPDGNLLATTDAANGVYSYVFNALNQLVGFCSPACGGNAGSYRFDRYGNLLQEQLNYAAPNPTLTATYTGNRIDGASYDAAGNLLFDGNHHYTFDAENRVTQVDGGATASYIYDAFGRRVQSVVGGTMTEFLYDPGGPSVSMDAAAAPVREQAGLGARPLAAIIASGVYYTHSDALGTVRARSQAGTPVESDTSLPFGEERSSSNAVSPLHFTGKFEDGESQLDYFGARYYSSTLGRFLTPDWSDDPSDPIPYANLANPQSLNLYAYVNNNPVTLTDSSGHAATGEGYPGEGLNSFGDGSGDGGNAGGDGGAYADAAAADGPTNPNECGATDVCGAGGWALAPQPQAASNTIEVEHDAGNNPFGHAVIGVDGATPVGLVPNSDLAAAAAVAAETAAAVIGKPESFAVDGHIAEANADRKVLEKVALNITPGQAKAIEKFVKAASQNKLKYDPGCGNCATFVTSALRAGGMNVAYSLTPHGVIEELRKISDH